MNLTEENGVLNNRVAQGLVWALLMIVAAAGGAAEKEFTWQGSSSVTYETGKYGTDHETTLLYWPVTLKRFLGKGDVSLTVPYVELDTQGGRTVLDGSVVPGTGSGGAGLGDVSIKGCYNWIEQNDMLPFVDLIARLKLPTADKNKGLGTGEPDIGFGMEVARRFRSDYLALADLTYTFIGDPPGVSYQDRIDADVGAGYQFTREWLGCVYYNYRSAISTGSADARSVSFLGNYKMSPELRFYCMIELGLSDGAPDYGLTVGASCRF